MSRTSHRNRSNANRGISVIANPPCARVVTAVVLLIATGARIEAEAIAPLPRVFAVRSESNSMTSSFQLQVRGGSSMVMDEDEIDYKAKAEWWKDPLAMFDDEEETNDSSAASETPSQSAVEEVVTVAEPTETNPEEMSIFTEEIVSIVDDPIEESVTLEPEKEEVVESILEEPTIDEIKPKQEETMKPLPSKQAAEKKKANQAAKKEKKKKQKNTDKQTSKKSLFGMPSKNQLSKGLFGRSQQEPKENRRTSPSSSTGGVNPLALVGPLVPKLKDLLALNPAAAKMLGLVALGTGVSNILLRKSPEQEELDLMRRDEKLEEFQEDDIDLDKVLREERQREKHIRHHGEEISSTVERENDAGAKDKKQPATILEPPPSGKMPNKRKLWEQVQELHGKLETAESSKARVNSEYEKASIELQKAVSEVNNLKTTTTYLKAQLSENEDLLKRTVQTERRKAKDELMRLKNSMVEVVERERKSMRDEFMKQASELETLMWTKQQQNPQKQLTGPAVAKQTRTRSRAQRRPPMDDQDGGGGGGSQSDSGERRRSPRSSARPADRRRDPRPRASSSSNGISVAQRREISKESRPVRRPPSATANAHVGQHNISRNRNNANRVDPSQSRSSRDRQGRGRRPTPVGVAA